MGVPKFSQLGLLQLWGHITSCENLRLQWCLKQSYSLCWELSKGMLHSTCTHWGRVDSWLLMVRSQTTSLIFSLSFCHNLCFRCSNGSCKPIFDIYTSIAFQWYKQCFNARCFDPWNQTQKFWESRRTPSPHFENVRVILPLFQSRVATRDSNSQHWSSLGSVRVHALTLFALPGIGDATPGSLSWPAHLQPLALVVSPRSGLQQKKLCKRKKK